SVDGLPRNTQVGSGTITAIGTAYSRSTATGLGPRATTGRRDNASTSFSRGCFVSTALKRMRVPTPVRKITASNFPAKRSSAKDRAAEFSFRGISRMDGATRAYVRLKHTSAPSHSHLFLSNPTTSHEVLYAPHFL